MDRLLLNPYPNVSQSSGLVPQNTKGFKICAYFAECEITIFFLPGSVSFFDKVVNVCRSLPTRLSLQRMDSICLSTPIYSIISFVNLLTCLNLRRDTADNVFQLSNNGSNDLFNTQRFIWKRRERRSSFALSHCFMKMYHDRRVSECAGAPLFFY